MPLRDWPTLSLLGTEEAVRQAWNLRREDQLIVKSLEDDKLDGRQMTDRRAVPSSATDVVTGDTIGDKLNDATYQYELIDDSGTLKWDRRTLDIGW